VKSSDTGFAEIARLKGIEADLGIFGIHFGGTYRANWRATVTRYQALNLSKLLAVIRGLSMVR
jgi:hypothetical protein